MKSWWQLDQIELTWAPQRAARTFHTSRLKYKKCQQTSHIPHYSLEDVCIFCHHVKKINLSNIFIEAFHLSNHFQWTSLKNLKTGCQFLSRQLHTHSFRPITVFLFQQWERCRRKRGMSGRDNSNPFLWENKQSPSTFCTTR